MNGLMIHWEEKWSLLKHLILFIISNMLLLCIFCGASLVAQTVKHLPTVLETQVQSLGREDPLEKEMATHSSILAW